MSGLRFDSARSTFMSRSSTQSTTYTWSGWFKLTSAATNSCLFSLGEAGAKGSARVGVDIATNGQLIYLANPNVSISGFTADLNKWYHLVMQVDSAVKFYVDGVLINSSSSPYSEEDFNFTCIGAIASETSADQFNGYMSDVYFVDGQALEPSDFGKFYEGLWGPIPSETILNNITRSESPYDQRPNMDEKWSDGTFTSVNASSSSSADVLFNGSLSNPGFYGANITWGSPIISGIQTFEVYLSGLSEAGLPNGINNARNFKVNNIQATTSNTTANGSDGQLGWYTFDAGITEFTSFQVDNELLQVAAIRINGKILVDGPANNSQNWSGSFTCADGFYNTNTPEKAFDGDASTRASTSSIATTNETPMILDLSNNPIENVTSVSAFCQGRFIVNGVEISAVIVVKQYTIKNL